MNNLQYIVTGTGRCGTNFVAKMLTKLDIPCGHECIFDFEPLDKIIKKIYHPHLRKLSFCSTHNLELKSEIYEELEQWVDAEKTIADSSYMAAPYLNMVILNHVKIIHIVRNPIKVISSFLKSLNYFNDSNPNNEWEQKIFETLPELKKINNPIERACYYYVNWNNLIEKKSNKDNTIICKIENITNNLYFFKFINKEKTEINLPNNVNTINKRIEDFKIKDIPNGSIKKDFLNTINKYGYL
jgi:hypothetical protein